MLPTNALGDLLNLGNLEFAQEAFATTNTGSVTTQADTAQRNDVARRTYDVDGTGVRVGILSDSFDTNTTATDHFADNVLAGDLAADTQILIDQPRRTDEGRAMAQLVHDLAPGSPISFATDSARERRLVGLAEIAQHGE